MNKELIRKYKKEFDHWLYGGKVLSYNTRLCKKWTNDNSKFIWQTTEKDIHIVMDDEYVEFRKALAEGKLIQYYNTEVRLYNSSKPLNTWIDTNSISTNGRLSDYRIKPEEPKFKVGDWVRLKVLDKTTHKLIKLDWNEHTKCYHPILEKFNGNIDSVNELELWEPQVGEWCWFYDNGIYEIPVLGKFSKLNDETVDIEPFIGELPTYLKEE